MSGATFELLEAQSQLEQRFNCIICLSPKLRMVYGVCQHRLCEECLYSADGERRNGMERCPVCQKLDSFPLHRPDIPEDNVDIQKNLGIRRCPLDGCFEELWIWELTDHQKNCHNKTDFPPKLTHKSSKGGLERIVKHQFHSSRLQSLGPVVQRNKALRAVSHPLSTRRNGRLWLRRNAHYSQTYAE